MATVQFPPEQRLRLSQVPWQTYVRFRDDLGQRPVRITYDRGEMEITTLPFQHEGHKHLLDILVVELAVEMNVDIAGYGSATCRRQDLDRGLEGDECYWIENEPKVRGRKDIDLEIDPPPDLALEVEISRSSLDRMGIYAALRVPEVWRWDGKTLRVFLLTSEGTYEESSRKQGLSFPPSRGIRELSHANRYERDPTYPLVSELGSRADRARLAAAERRERMSAQVCGPITWIRRRKRVSAPRKRQKTFPVGRRGNAR